MTGLWVVVTLTLVASALCSLFEATLYSTRVASLEAARDQGRHASSAGHFLRLKRNIAVPTSAILILNTVANTAGATVAGMMAADALGSRFIPLFSGLLTLAILLLAEILPKTYGATHWKTLWPLVVWPLLALEKLLRPLIWMTQSFADLFVGKHGQPATTGDEIIAMIRMGANSGELSTTELRLLTSVFRFDKVQAGEVMFSRREAVIFDVSWDVARCLETARNSQHTRYPLCDGSMDRLLGLIHVKDLLHHLGEEQVDLKALARPLRRVPETMPAQTLLREMRTTQPHMVAVVDEHGTVTGLVTLENLLEQLVGSVQDEFDEEDPDLVKESDGVYNLRGAMHLSRLNVELELTLPEGEASTVSGLLVAKLGRLPRVGDTLELEAVFFEVLEADDHVASRVRLTLAEGEDGD